LSVGKTPYFDMKASLRQLQFSFGDFDAAMKSKYVMVALLQF